jgi:PAS domain S-box-containing protein
VSTIERILVLAILGGIFLLDSVSPLGFSTWLLYLLPTLYISSRAGKTETIFYASLISALVIIDFFISPPGLRPLLAATNRAFLITALWTLSYLNFRRRGVEKKLIAANETIRESEGTLRTIFDNSNDAILVHAPDGKIINVNRRMLEMYQIEYRNALSLSIFDLSFSDNPLDSVPGIWGRVIDGKNQLLEWKARRPKDHSVFDVEVYLTRIRYRGETAILATMRDISERKRMEDELRLTRFSIDSASICAYLVARDARLLYVNEQTCRTLGYTRDELLSMGVYDLDPDFPRSVWDAHWAQLKKEGGLHFQTTQRRKDGTLVPLEISLNFLAFGGREYNVAFGLDISERKKAEQEIALANRWLELILKSAGEGILGLDDQGSLTFINRAAVGMLGYEEQELIGRHGPAVWHCSRPDGTAYPAGECPVFTTSLDEADHSGEAVFWRRDSTSFPIEYTSTSFCEDGLSGAVVTFRDITGRKRAEEDLKQAYASLETKVRERTRALAEANHELRREIAERQKAEEALQTSEKRFRDLIETTSDWVWEIDKDGIYTYASSQVRKLLGYEPREVLGKTPFDLMPPEEAERLFPVFKGIVASGKPIFFLENLNLHKNGTKVVLETSGVPFFDASGSFMGYRGIDRDITERKRIEEELQKAQRLDSIGLLAGGIAHDFNNILTAIQGNIELAGMYLPADNRAAARLAVAGKALIRARTLSQQLLTFAKGGAPITKTMEVSSLVREPVENSLRGSKAEVAYSIAKDLPPVEADETQIGQAIGNLAANAVESMPEGGVLTVTAGKEYLPLENNLGLPTGEYVRIDIKDQGAGIPPELREKIFDPYFTTKEQGSGLGLAIAYSIIKKHGGTIRVDSAPGEGSTFSIFLPVSHMARSPQSMGENAKVLQPG